MSIVDCLLYGHRTVRPSVTAPNQRMSIAWLSPERSEDISRLTLFERAPEICVEIVSSSNSRSEINEKRALYFDAGAAEVWICNPDGHISFFAAPHNQLPASSICPAFPGSIP